MQDAQNWLDGQIRYYRGKYTAESDLSVAVCSFNVNNKRVPMSETPIEQSLKKWLRVYESPKIIAIGLQEIDMNAHSVLFGETDAQNYWKMVLCHLVGADEDERSITQSYFIVASKQLVGLYLCVFVHKSILPDVCLDEISVNTVSIGKSLGPIRENRKSALFNFGNKGAVGLHLRLQEVTIAFVNAHLHPHMDGMHKRRKGVSTIMSEMTFEVPATIANYHQYERYFNASAEEVSTSISDNLPKDSGNSYSISLNDHNAIFFFGDLNFRLNHPPNYAVKRSVMTNDWSDMFNTYDQLQGELQKGAADVQSGWYGFHEEHPKRIPTYRYVANKNMLDLPGGILTDDPDDKRADKGRVPGFTDRILWKEPKALNNSDSSASNAVSCANFTIHSEVDFSDHKPISGIFHVRKPATDPEKKALFQQSLLENLQKSPPFDVTTQFSVDKISLHFDHLAYGTSKTETITLRNDSQFVLPVRIRSRLLHPKPSASSGSNQSRSPFKLSELSSQEGTPQDVDLHRLSSIDAAFVQITEPNILLYPGETRSISVVCTSTGAMRNFQCDSALRVGSPVELQQFISIEPVLPSEKMTDHLLHQKLHVTADVTVSNFGNKIENLCLSSSEMTTEHLPQKAELKYSPQKGVMQESPHFDPSLTCYPLWWLLHFLSQNLLLEELQNLTKTESNFLEMSDDTIELIQAIDTQLSREEDWECNEKYDNTPWRTAYNALHIFLLHLQEPIVESVHYEAIISRAKDDYAVFDTIVEKFSKVHQSAFFFLISFVRYVLGKSFQVDRKNHSAVRERILQDFSASIIRRPISQDPFDRHEEKEEVLQKRLFLDYFLTMEEEGEFFGGYSYDSEAF